MPAQRDIKRRILSVRNTRKITKAMEMVAAARLRRAQQRIEAARPYALNMMEFIAGLVRYLQVDVNSYPLLKKHEKVRRVAVVALTADRGMCGAFNSNIVRRALDRVHAYQAEGIETDLIVVGRKGIGTLRFQRYKLLSTYVDITDRSAFLDAQAIAHRVAELYVTEKVDRVHLVFNRFKSALEQFITDQVILPIQEELVPEYTPEGAAAHMDFIFEPSAETILEDLIPTYLEIAIYRALLEGMASEHGARMTAMRNASDAADEMIDELTLAMNRVRQASITQEILEVVAGADALSG
ncbi:MAG TPA: ATP synthase F1 subunit gamma [Thermoleophilia bacterium]|jgi:F-type H+-transporting ATPase subunit gamma